MAGKAPAAPPVQPQRRGPPPEALGASDEGQEFELEPPLPCAYCGHVLTVGQVVRLAGDAYAYACHGCALRSAPTNGDHQ